MPVHYNEFLDCAKQFLEGNNPTEMELRNSSSRAYYYLFHKIRETFRGHSEAHFRNGTGDHEEALKFLRRIGELTLANRFHYCKAKRQKADYDINESLTETEAEDQISEVEGIGRKIDEF